MHDCTGQNPPAPIGPTRERTTHPSVAGSEALRDVSAVVPLRAARQAPPFEKSAYSGQKSSGVTEPGGHLTVQYWLAGAACLVIWMSVWLLLILTYEFPVASAAVQR